MSGLASCRVAALAVVWCVVLLWSPKCGVERRREERKKRLWGTFGVITMDSAQCPDDGSGRVQTTVIMQLRS